MTVRPQKNNQKLVSTVQVEHDCVLRGVFQPLGDKEQIITAQALHSWAALRV